MEKRKNCIFFVILKEKRKSYVHSVKFACNIRCVDKITKKTKKNFSAVQKKYSQSDEILDKSPLCINFNLYKAN